MHLHAKGGDFDADVGGKRLGNRREQRHPLVRCLAHHGISGALGAVKCDRGDVADRARRGRERAHGQKHAAHVRVRDDR